MHEKISTGVPWAASRISPIGPKSLRYGCGAG